MINIDDIDLDFWDDILSDYNDLLEEADTDD